MPELNEKGKLEDVISLRCKYCGAPLDCKDETKELIRCNSCGTTQKMIDARAFLEQIMGHVYSWVSAAIPSGFDLSRSENVDPIARHNIFINNVKPILETEYREYKFNSMNLFTNTLLILPFKTDTSIQPLNKASDVFEFNAKIKSIVPLAINDESKKLISEVIGLSTAYAYYLNNLDLISNEKLPERFNFMASNFLEAAKMLEKNEKFIPLYERSNGLNNAALAIRYLLDGNIYTAKSYIEKSLQNFGSAKTTLMSNFDLGIMFQAIEKEILVGKAIGYMITAAERDPSGSPLHTVSLIENMIRILSRQETYNHGQWGSYLKDISRCEEIFKWVQDIRNTQYGDPALKIVGGGGNILFPFWVVDLPYSFKTGSLWMKKGIEVTEKMLVSASFTTDENILSRPSLAITDVFKARQNYGFFDGITGKETSISGGGGPIKKIVDSATPSSAGGRKIIPPLSTMKEASYLVERYIDQTAQTDRTIAAKLKLSAQRVIGLIFIPGDINGSTFRLNVDLNALCPQNIGNLSQLSTIIM